MSDRGYEKHVLQGAIAGLITGLVVGLLALALAQRVSTLVEDLLGQQVSGPLPPEAAKEVERIKEIVGALIRAAPVLYALQYTLLGALFGLVKGALRIKLGWGEAASALAAGGLFTLLLGAIPLAVLSVAMPELVGTVSRYLNPYAAALAPGTIFTVAIVFVGVARGPWTRLVEAKPGET